MLDTPREPFSPRLASNTFSTAFKRYYVRMRHLLLILLGLIVSGGLGYFIGYDHGFENAVSVPLQTSAFENSAASDAAGAMANIIGFWQSNEDTAFTREFLNDGTVVDRYSEESDDGLWMVFTKEIPDTAFTGPLEEGAVYLAIAMGEDEKYYFKVTRADSENLELMYLDRGGSLTFTRQ